MINDPTEFLKKESTELEVTFELKIIMKKFFLFLLLVCTLSYNAGNKRYNSGDGTC